MKLRKVQHDKVMYCRVLKANPKIHYFWLVSDRVSEINIASYMKLRKDGHVFASSALWPNSGRKCLKTSAQTRTRPIKPDLQLYTVKNFS